MFRRRRQRSTPSSEMQVGRAMQQARLARLVGGSFGVDELPITVGLANLHADVISTLELQAVDRKTKKPVDNTPDLIEQPDPDEDRQVTIHKIVQSLWWTGNAESYVYDFGAGQTTFKVINPTAVGYDPYTDPARDLEIKSWIVHGLPARVDQIEHWKLNDDPRRGPMGRSPLQQCWPALENYAWAYRYLAAFFVSGGNPSIVLRSKIERTDRQISEAQEQWVAARQVNRPTVITPTWELAESPEVKDIDQTVEVLNMAAQEVCRLTGMPPSIAAVASPEGLDYKNVQEEFRRWLLLSLGPRWLRRVEAGFTHHLDDRLIARFDQDQLLEFDILDGRDAPDAKPTRPNLELVPNTGAAA